MTTTIFVINTGSSSVRLSAHTLEGGVVRDLRRVRHSSVGGWDPVELLREFAQGIEPPVAILHRVVLGNVDGALAIRVDDCVERGIEAVSPRARLHNPVALEWLRASRAEFPEGDPIAVFDTGFFEDLPPAAAQYALPAEYRLDHRIRRCGFHGLAHSAMVRRWRELHPSLDRGGRVITVQLGSGASMTATAQGAPQDTSMGFSPLEGLVMTSRPGDVDPGVILYLLESGGIAVRDLSEALSRRSGLRGLAGSDERIDELLRSTRPEARLAVDVFVHCIRRYLGAFMNVLGGCDGIVFGGGIGENVPEIRERALAGMDWCGVALDTEANRRAVGIELDIGAPDQQREVWVIPVDEAAEMIESAKNLLAVENSAEGEVSDG